MLDTQSHLSAANEFPDLSSETIAPEPESLPWRYLRRQTLWPSLVHDTHPEARSDSVLCRVEAGAPESSLAELDLRPPSHWCGTRYDRLRLSDLDRVSSNLVLADFPAAPGPGSKVCRCQADLPQGR